MDFRFNDDEQMVHDMCSRFAKEVLAEAGAKADLSSQVPDKLMNEAIDLGLFIDAVPVEQQGYLEGAFDHKLRAVRSMALAAGCPALTLRFEANTEFALAAQAMKFVPALESIAATPGQTLACTALESELKPLTLKAEKISGVISSVPNAVGAAWYVIVSNESAAAPFVAIVAGDNKGIAVLPRHGMALRASAVGDISLTNVVADTIITGDAALKLLNTIRASYRLLSASLAVGSTLQGLEYAELYAADRVQFAQPIGKFQSIARLIAEDRSRLVAAKYLILAAADALDTGIGAIELCKQAADVAGQFATTAAIDAVQIYGGYGFVNDYPVEKIMRDARACTTLAGDALQEMVFDQCA